MGNRLKPLLPTAVTCPLPRGKDAAIRKIEHAGEAGKNLVRLNGGGGVPLVPGDPGSVPRRGGVPYAGAKLIGGGGNVLIPMGLDPILLHKLQGLRFGAAFRRAQGVERVDALVKVGAGEDGLGRGQSHACLNGLRPLRGVPICTQGDEGRQSLLLSAGLFQGGGIVIGLLQGRQASLLGLGLLLLLEGLPQGLSPGRVPFRQQVCRIGQLVGGCGPIRLLQKKLIQAPVQHIDESDAYDRYGQPDQVGFAKQLKSCHHVSFRLYHNPFPHSFLSLEKYLSFLAFVL